jgi:hypothetical protein
MDAVSCQGLEKENTTVTVKAMATEKAPAFQAE